MTGGCRRVAPNILLRGSLSISGSKHDLEFIELVPLGIGPLSVRDRQKRLQALSRGNRARFIHGDTLSLFDGFFSTRVILLGTPDHCSIFTPASLITFARCDDTPDGLGRVGLRLRRNRGTGDCGNERVAQP